MKKAIAALRNQFAVYVVDADDVRASLLASRARAVGYVQALPSPTSGFDYVVATEPPHILLYDIETSKDAATFLGHVRSSSPETRTIVVTDKARRLEALELVSAELAYDVIVRPLETDLDLEQSLDRATTQIFTQFESEQALEKLRASAPSSSVSQAAPSELVSYLDRLSATRDLEETIQIYMNEISREAGGASFLYFKYLPSHASLPLSQATHLEIEKLRGLGLGLRDLNPSELKDFFKNPERSTILKDFVRQAFRTESFSAFTHFNENDALGLFVGLAPSSGGVKSYRHLQELPVHKIFEIAWKKNLTLKEKHTLDTTDSATGLVNRRSFTERVENEVSRARRIRMPLSLITIDCDHFNRINERLGFQQADSLLKAIGAILKKTTRVNDIVARTGPDEFSLLFPHTGHIGAAVKAERLRRMLETARFPILGQDAGSLTVSIGVSEYPSFCADGESLVRSADEALVQVRDSSHGNKVCLATAPFDFKMDFVPREVSEER